jgi:putative tryptophan/tyrosine transport system substrate-binding protein
VAGGYLTPFVAANVEVIVAATGMTALTAKRATSTIPIVMAGSADAAILTETLPRLKGAAAVWCPEIPINRIELDRIQLAAKPARLVVCRGVPNAPSVGGDDGFVPAKSPGRAVSSRLYEPSVGEDYPIRNECTGADHESVRLRDTRGRSPIVWRRYGGDVSPGGPFVDKILRGATPTDLPVEQPTKLELIINLNTATLLGLTIPPSLLLRADQVIQSLLPTADRSRGGRR